jgi:EmrB/QacA subfamily drug resistance transporter
MLRRPMTDAARRWLLLASMLLGSTLATLSSGILSVSVVPLMDEFRVGLPTVQWFLTSYNLVFAALMIGFGSLGDAVGRRRLYLGGQLVFVLGSGLASVAAGPWQFAAARAIQGAGAAALAPNALALIHDLFPAGQRGVALGTWGAAVALGGALGPTLGGAITETWGWRAVFLVDLPLGLAAAAATYRLLSADDRRQPTFDVGGFVTLGAALLALAVAIMGAPGLGAEGRAVLAGVAVLLATAFWAIERRARTPLVDLPALGRPGVVAAYLSVLFALLTMSGGMFLSVMYAGLLADASPRTIGLLLTPCAATSFAVAPLAGLLTDRLGPRLLATTGLLALAVSVAVPVWWHPASAGTVVLWSSVIAGAGVGLSTPALIRVSTESIAGERVGLGAGVYKTVNELGAVFGIILLGALLEGRIGENALRGLPGHFLPDEVSLKFVTSLKTLEDHALRKGLPVQDLVAFHQALVGAVRRSFDQAFGVAALVGVVGAGVALLLPKRLPEGRGEPITAQAPQAGNAANGRP